MADTPKKRSYRNAQFAVEYLLGHPSASNEEVVKRTGASPRSVTRARAMLVATGALQRSYYDRQHRPIGPNGEPLDDGAGLAPASPVNDLPVVGPRDPADLEKALRADHGPALTTEQMKQRYSAIARYGAKTGEFTLEIQAMQALGRLDSQTGVRDRLGPGVPHTREDRRDRVQPILEAAGPSIVAEAAVLAYDKDEFAKFLDFLGHYMSRKVADEQQSSKNRSTQGVEGTPGSEIPEQDVPTAEIGPRDADVGAETGHDGGTTHGGGASGAEGS